MIQIILLIVAISALIRLPKVKRRTANNYPSVSAEKFKLWHEADLKATIAFIIVTWGTLALQIVILVIGGYIKHRMSDYNGNIDMILIVLTLVVFLVPLFWPAILGSKAARFKKEAGIGREKIVGIQEQTESNFSGLAIVGLVCAIIGLILFFGIGIVFGGIGFILGFVSINKINRSFGRIKGKGMAIAAAIVGVVAIVLQISTLFTFVRMREKAKISATLGAMNTIRTAIELYKLDTGSYPQDLSILISNSTGGNTYLKELPKDVWGRDYIYSVKSDESFELFSLGPDGIGGNKDDVKLSNF